MKTTLYFVLMGFLSPTLASAQQVDILKIFEHFTVSSAVAGQCIKPSDAELTSFLANYQTVVVSALTEIKKRNPSLTDDQASKIMKDGGVKLTESAITVIKERGCDSPAVKTLIDRFYRQAAWQP
ncbi:hypothetical protein [Sessilibacter corallicola]|uniref:Uncharacterized protein n=1 Tax=Sessilibacter corallicola TaxID=2904075 RepID=A0ABQ0ACP0_9GAMM|nr:hypothetical protein [Sessilibacter corallicola]MCE2029806.1 hypothetical protein [Sessilibacter corallicola]